MNADSKPVGVFVWAGEIRNGYDLPMWTCKHRHRSEGHARACAFKQQIRGEQLLKETWAIQ